MNIEKEMLLELCIFKSLYQAVKLNDSILGKIFLIMLHETRENLLFEIQKGAVRNFEGKTNPTNVYVLAEENSCKKKIWQEYASNI